MGAKKKPATAVAELCDESQAIVESPNEPEPKTSTAMAPLQKELEVMTGQLDEMVSHAFRSSNNRRRRELVSLEREETSQRIRTIAETTKLLLQTHRDLEHAIKEVVETHGKSGMSDALLARALSPFRQIFRQVLLAMDDEITEDEIGAAFKEAVENCKSVDRK